MQTITTTSNGIFLLPTDRGVKAIAVENLVRIEALSNYSRLYFSDGKNLVVARVLRKFEETLAMSGFVRIHHKHLVNVHWVHRFKPVGQQTVLANGDVLPVSRRKVKTAKTAIAHWLIDRAA